MFANSSRGMAGMRAEQAALPQTFRQAQALTTLGTTPLVVLTAKDNVDRKLGWVPPRTSSPPCRRTPATLSPTSTTWRSSKDPAGSALSITAITDVVTAVRTHAPLPTP